MVMSRINLLTAFLIVLAGLWVPKLPQAAEEETRHCPAANPQNTFIFFAPGAKPENEKHRLDAVAEGIVTQKSPVCILAYTNPKDAAHSKKLAIRRVLWARENLGSAGVPQAQMSYELRPAEEDADKSVLQSVTLILGH